MSPLSRSMNSTYQWQDVYLEAVLETDTSKLQQRIAAAEGAVKARMTELEQDHHGTPEERSAIADALNGLRILRRERIND